MQMAVRQKKLYERYSQKTTGREIIGLPSTSPANAAYSLDRLMEYWSVIKGGVQMVENGVIFGRYQIFHLKTYGGRSLAKMRCKIIHRNWHIPILYLCGNFSAG